MPGQKVDPDDVAFGVGDAGNADQLVVGFNCLVDGWDVGEGWVVKPVVCEGVVVGIEVDDVSVWPRRICVMGTGFYVLRFL